MLQLDEDLCRRWTPRLDRQRLTPLEHPSSVSALRADPPSPKRGEGARACHPSLIIASML
ncbi:MAG: hypothetical protein EOS76_07055 [Mesorhizobium sp.]|nr:hypothetical protein EOA25_24980 [Mesorhizobium sp. M2A.F.Ca.ET.040.01.1.1]RVC67357.1 hypothetical protein EN766_31785 [Mesorhizobium sp. M2A.F.Ca.ET.046.02.1.1]RVC67563.1 hypothetical protein EN759_14865 [Mesorhizobium sp. M00.F.Ca.ET.038.03.1.1]RWA80975.1 MAG: hypothetical protein EOQ31_32065 [Mesorhizobium sp.]RWX59711.1 hypothetical protein EOA24_35180 [Mesorhizobium sp. M2A.F.Ca.ET.039.01.1.1]